MAQQEKSPSPQPADTSGGATAGGRGGMVASSGLGQLTKMLNEHMDRMKSKDDKVEKFINNFASSTLLKDAKVKAVETETKILKSIMDDIMNMTEFLNNIVLIENLFNREYGPHKSEQEAARAKYAPTIEKYESKPKVNSEVASFVELMFGGQTVHSGSFQKWLDKINKICKEKSVKVVSNSGAHYKAFYVYSSDTDDGYKEMTDVLRCSIIFDNFADLYKAYAIIEEVANKDLPGGILRLKDRFNPKNMPFGYRDLLINVYCPGSKIVCEIQLHHVLFYKLKRISHRMYVKARLFEREGYNAAYQYATTYVKPRVGSKCYQLSDDDVLKSVGSADDSKTNGNGDDEEEEEVTFRDLLKLWKLDKYADKFEDEGWDDPEDWHEISDEELKDDMGFSKGHVKKFNRKYKEWREEQKEKKENKSKSKTDELAKKQAEEQAAAMMKVLEEQKKFEAAQKKMMDEQEKRYKEQLEKLKKQNSMSDQWETKVFVHAGDFDTNGIVYQLATQWGKLPWKNPSDQGKVVLRSSGVKSDSQPLRSIVGREAVRCLMNESADAWFSIDFLSMRICPTKYTLKHYVSWNIEALRNWNLEGSIDGVGWTLIKSHRNDAKLKGKGGTATWDVSNCTSYFSQFRIKLTGKNDNGHHYLCCSGFEVYGTVKKGSALANLPKPVPTVQKEEPMKDAVIKDPSCGKVFTYKSDFDSNGVIHYLATNKGTEQWKNPVDRGTVKVSSTRLISKSVPLKNILGKDCLRLATDAVERAWMCIDLGDVYVKPTHYTLKHYVSWDTEALRTWELHGSNGCRPGVSPEWLIIRKHSNDTSLNKKGATKTWDIPPISTDEAFNKFRIVITGMNSNQHWYLACSGMEIYGQILHKTPDYVAPPKPLSLGDEMEFEYEYDFDENGLLYYLGTYAGTQNWTNPGIAGVIGVSGSSLGKDSQRIGSFCGRKVVRCLTKDEKNADMLINLKEVKMKVTQYTLRHYASWDTEALRDWNLEGSNDGSNWVAIKRHKGDTALQKKGQSHTWEVKTDGWFQYFRIIMTGPNSNSHHMLCCSGIELYGVAAGGFVSNPPIYQKKADPEPPHKTFSYVGKDFDENGLLYYMGTMNKTQKWTNPHTIALCAVSASALVADSESIINFAGRSAVRCVTKEHERADMMIDLKEHRIKVTHYTLRHYSSWDTEALRNWDLEASHDGKAWVCIKRHKNDTALKTKGQAHTWKVDVQDEFFQYFRIILTGPNSNNHNYLACSGIEFYGTAAGGLIKNPVKLAPPPPPPYREFKHQSDFDTNGIIYWLGTNGGTAEWKNPATDAGGKLITASSSALMSDSVPISAICDRKLVRCVTQDKVNAWWLLNFNKMRIRPTAYTIKHYSSWDTECLRDWKLEGKNPDGKWRLIASHKNDMSLTTKGSTHTWQVETKEFFQQLSLMMTGKNSNNHWYLACSGVEFYGIAAGGIVSDANSNLDELSDYDYADEDEKDALEPGQSAVKPLGKLVMADIADSQSKIVEDSAGWRVTADSNFPSIRGNFSLKRGAWYYEVKLLTAGCIQIGFADNSFVSNMNKGSGVGDHSHSWAYDGWRQKKWNGANMRYGGDNKWKVGDIVGCCVDIDAGTIKFYLNGTDLGVAYSDVKFRSSACYPAVSLQGGTTPQAVIFVFDSNHFKYPIPSGYSAINTSNYFKKAATWTSGMVGDTAGGGNGNYTESPYKFLSPGSVALTGIAFGDNRFFANEFSVVIRRVYYKLSDDAMNDEVINYEAGCPPHGVVNIKRKTLSREKDEYCNEVEVYVGTDNEKKLNAIRGFIFKTNKGKQTKVGFFKSKSNGAAWTKTVIKPPSPKYGLCGFEGTHHYMLKNIKFTFAEMA